MKKLLRLSILVSVILLHVSPACAITLSETHTNVTCYGGNNGTITITTTSGVAPFSFLWNDADTQQNRTGLIAGLYSVTATDNVGATASLSVNITQATDISINTTSVQPNCNGGSDGSITIFSVVGGAGPYSFVWNDGNTNQNRTGLIAGTYSVTATSSTFCTATSTIILGEPTPIAIILTPISLTCFGSNNGAINTTVTGGTPAYSYLWSDGGITKNRTGLASGTYSVTVTDLKGCTVTVPTSALVPQPLQLSATATPSDLACTGGPTGSVFTSVSGGNAPYSYWWGSGVVTPNRINVNSGTYTVTVTDANGCSSTASATINPYTALTISSTQVNNVCFGGNSGSVNILVNNGWTPYTFVWSHGSTTQNINALASGTYTVTVTDNHGCTITRSATITQPPFPMVINSTVADVLCYGGNNGSVNLNVLNGTAPLTYNWGSGITTQNRTTLSAGSYPVTVTDNVGCSGSISMNVNQPPLLTVVPTATNTTCFGGSNGQVNIDANGGWAPYTFLWSNTATTEDLLAVAAGSYGVTVTDNHSCTSTASIVVGQPTVLTAAVTAGQVSCQGGNDGWINATPSGGTPPYFYNWAAGSTASAISGLVAGAYPLTITDNVGCTFSASTSITQPASVQINNSVTAASCNGGSDGAISLSIVGGTPPFTFLWEDGSTVQNRTGITAGSYVVTVTDFALCSATDTITVGEATSISVSGIKSDVTCFGGNNATIQLNVSGGTSPYFFAWSDSIQTQNRSGLIAGNYNVTTTDNAGCTTINSFTINQPTTVSVSSTVSNVTCFGGNNGEIILTATGGTTGYSYNWGGGIITKDRTAIPAGNYNVTVTDNSTCSTSYSVSVAQPNALSISASVSDVSCNGGANGSINLTVTGGVPGYSYDWGNGMNSVNLTNLSLGNYPVTITDANSCTVSNTFAVAEPSAIALVMSKLDIACYGQSSGRIDLTVTGGSPSYTFNWGGGVSTQNLTGVSTGTYTVTATDSHGCTATASENIIQPTQMSTTIFSITNPSCHGLQDGRVDIGVNGGTPPYNYLWSNGSVNRTLTNAGGGNQSVTVTDANQCTALTSINLNQPAAISIGINKTDITCYGAADGAIVASATGGKGGFTYTWNTSANIPSLNSLSASTYSLTVKDISNCSAVASVVINEPSPLSISETHQDVSCNGSASGTITIQSSGGTGTHTYRWNDNSTSSGLNNLGPGNYSVTVTDANSCSADRNITINETSTIVVTEQHTDYACATKPGTVSIHVTGGVPPYRYDWNDGVTIKDRSNMSAGAYHLTVTDAVSCSASRGVDIAAIPAMIASLAKTDIICGGTPSGAIHASVSGGTSGYSYRWNTGATSTSLTNLVAGDYQVTITDGFGCTTTSNETISQQSPIQISETIQNALCYGMNDGAISVTVAGGAGPYAFQWNDNTTTQNLANATAGNYSVTVTDANQCTATKTNLVIGQPSNLVVQSAITPAGCTGQSSGAVALQVSGGTSPYSYSWNNQETTATINQLDPGNYSVTITDNHLCTLTENFEVMTAQPIMVQGNAHNTSCPAVENGRIDLTVTGGSPAYSYNWNNGQFTKNLNNLPQGNYSVTVSDSKGCQSVVDFTITYDYDLVIDASPSTTVLNGQTAELSVTANNDHRNRYTWTPSATVVCDECRETKAFPQESTTYTVDVVDANGCRASDTVHIEVRPVTDKLFLPNAFTPNNDGVNDVLELYGDRSDVRQLNFALFNRIGEKVFESDDHQFQWDGIFRGETSGTGVYRYMMRIVFADGTGKEVQGSVTILR